MISGEVRDIKKLTSFNGEEYYLFARNNNRTKIYKPKLN